MIHSKKQSLSEFIHCAQPLSHCWQDLCNSWFLMLSTKICDWLKGLPYPQIFLPSTGFPSCEHEDLKKNNIPGLCLVKGQKSALCIQTGAGNQFSSLSLSTTKTTPHYQMLVIHPAFCLSFYVLPRDPKDGSGCTNFWKEQSLASLSIISFPRAPASPGTQYSPTMCWVEISFNAFWQCHTVILYILYKIVMSMNEILTTWEVMWDLPKQVIE
jgi:hypothetical protein